MMELLILLTGIIPAVLIVLGGMMILREGPEQKSSQHFLLYLSVIGALLMSVAFVIEQISHEHYTWSIGQISILTAPIAIGVLALILVNLKLLAEFKSGEKILVTLLALISLLLMVGSLWGQSYGGMAQIILSGALVLVVIWVFVGKFDGLGVALSLVALIFLALFNAGLLENMPPLPDWVRLPFSLLFFSLPGLVVALAAVFVTSSLKLFSLPKEHLKLSSPPISWLPAALRFGLAAVLLGYLAYTTVWASIWDHTSDGLGGIMFFQLASMGAIAAGMLISLTTTSWRRFAGLIFALVVPIMMFGAFRYGWNVSYHAITEERASRIQHGVESFFSENGRYPKELRELIPKHLLWIPEPVILRGEQWCYQGGQDYYRLGAFFREFFGTPISLHTYASAGNLPEADWSCEEKLSEMKARYDPLPFYEQEEIRPTVEPLPTSHISFQRTSVSPLLDGGFITPGSWSPDGRFLVFSQLESSNEQHVTMLNFLNVDTGEICQAEKGYPPQSGLQEKHVWLPDGRLLFISEDSEIDLSVPCETGTENLTDQYPEQFTQVAAYDRTKTRILLKNDDSFWIMDGHNLDMWPIPTIRPNPYELHWDQYAWSPDGERLAISRLNGRDREAGSTLYLVEGDTGEVLELQSLEYAYDQSAPGVEWLTNDQLLLHGGGIFAIANYSSKPQKITNILKDIFGLDIAYPNDISSMASIVDSTNDSYYLVVRVNYRNNQDVYLYHSESRSVEIHHPSTNLLMFFPNEEFAILNILGFQPPEQDKFEMLWVNTPRQGNPHIEVQGHTPRNYPTLFPKYLAQSNQIAFSSSQGISLVSIVDGETLEFWELLNVEGILDINLRVSPNEEAMIAIVDGTKLYHIPLQRK